MKRIIVFIMTCIIFCNTHAQDSLSVEHLKPYTYVFDIVDGRLVGEGEAFLKQEMSKAQFTMLGEYHGSKRISEFTNAIIPILNDVGYKAVAFEVGPITGQILNKMEGNVESQLKEQHNKYLTKDDDGYVNTPFPFFDNKEDAQFLKTAKSNSWNVFGIDQEYYDSYVMLTDKMFSNMSKPDKKEHYDLYTKTIEELKQFYKDDQNDKQNFHVSLSNSELFKDFTQKMTLEPKNVEILNAMKSSSEIYLLNINRKWYENNVTRIKYMKSQLKRGLGNLNFNISTDKLLIKMGGYHLSKGFSPLGIYEVGNTLNELAEFNGNKALNIGFTTRFYMEDGQLKDNTASENRYYKNQMALIQMGKKDQWVVIDLRPLIKGYHYYPQKFKLNRYIDNLAQRYDLIIIPKVEVDGIPNYD